jgi:HlyD family secretion protein
VRSEGVYVVRDGRAVWTPVTLGITGQEYFEILSGLSPGDQVVAGPYQTIRALRDGDPVQITSGSTEPL